MTEIELLEKSFKLIRDGLIFGEVVHKEHVESFLQENERKINELQAENERLKNELEMEHDDCNNAKKCEIEYHKAYEKELDENVTLRKDNVKLHGSLMNLRFGYAYAMRRLFSGTNTEKYEFWKKLQTKFRSDREAYRKAKQELKEGK